jgi:glycosyltransferase involved in cell wall biosynthesis
VGWNWVRQIARFNEVWIVTRANNCQPIEEALSRDPLPNAHFVYFDLPAWTRFWKRRGYGVRPYYYLWQLGVFFLVKRLLRHTHFDLVHHLTFGNYCLPGFLAMLPVTFVLGPVGGGESAPRAFWWSFSMRGKIYEVLRSLRRSLGQLDPFVRLATRRASVVLATTDQTAEKLKRLGCRSVAVLSQVALNPNEICERPDSPDYQGNRFRMVSVGRFLHWKGFELGVRAFARFRERFPASEYWLIGDGPEKKRLEALSRKLGLADSIRFLGSIPRTQVLEKMAACDVLINPSLHDSGSYVCAEAMVLGLPVICLDLGGPALQVTEETGIKVPAASPEQVIGDLAAAMSQLASEPLVRERLGKSGQKHVREAWDREGDLMSAVYNRAESLARDLQC